MKDGQSTFALIYRIYGKNKSVLTKTIAILPTLQGWKHFSEILARCSR